MPNIEVHLNNQVFTKIKKTAQSDHVNLYVQF